jgi:hypothetical protein
MGLNFDEQWGRVFELEAQGDAPPFVWITGWNEWVAQRFLKEAGQGPGTFMGEPLQTGDSFFVDLATMEYSRDIEPMKGGYTDSYYYQMVANIRRYKGVRQPPTAPSLRRMTIDGAFDEWATVLPVYRDTRDDTVHRDHPGWGALQYTNTTGRNDIVAARVALDDVNASFYVETAQALTPATDARWMVLFIDRDNDAATGWEGYDLRVNATRQNGAPIIEEWSGGAWSRSGAGTMAHAGNRLELQVPRFRIGVNARTFAFKWVDNPDTLDDIIAFATSGDAAPNRRFNYWFSAEGATALVPVGPDNLTAAPQGAAVALAWEDHADGETGYIIERADGDGAFRALTTTRADATAYTDDDVDPGTVYRYRVRAFNGSGASPYSNVVEVTFFHPADVNRDGAVDALDVQTVINAALGLPVQWNCDVSGDDLVNAIDVQVVINAVLGV